MLKVQRVAPLAVASIVLVAGLVSCAYAGYDEPARPSAQSLADTEPFIEEMLAEDLGYHSPIRVDQARESSCLDPIHDHDMNRVTEVRTYASGHFPDSAAATEAMKTMEDYVESKGWTFVTKDSSADYQSFVYEMGDLSFAAQYEYAEPSAGSPYHEVGFDVRTGCRKQAKDHEMVRSKYDPDYGVTSQYYDFEAEEEDPANATQRRLATPYGEEVKFRR